LSNKVLISFCLGQDQTIAVALHSWASLLVVSQLPIVFVDRAAEF